MTAIADPTELGTEEQHALEALLVSLADDEFVLAERYTEWQVRAPTLESDLALSNIAQDELGHARLWYDVLGGLGHEEPALLYEREPEDFRHATLCEVHFEEGDWADAIVRSYLYDVAEELRLEALADSTVRKVANRVPKIAAEEEYHRDHATKWLERLVSDDKGHQRIQSALDRLYPHALTLFEPVTAPAIGRDIPSYDPADLESIILDAGFRSTSLEDLKAQWQSRIDTTFESYGLECPESEVPTMTGRNGEHTDAWFELHDEFTHTYRELERTDTTRIMPEPDDG